MKKNILLVQSLLIVPLLSSSFIFSAEKPTYAAAAQKGTQLPQPLKKSGSKKRNRKKQIPAQQLVESVEELQTTPKLYLSDEDKINAETDLKIAKQRIENQNLYTFLQTVRALQNDNGLNPIETQETLPTALPKVNMDTLKIKVTEDLETSFMAPSERIELGFSERIKYALSTYRAMTIDLLNNETFETNNAAHTEYFNKALEECAQQKDLASLQAIINACQKEPYKQGMQSAINHVAPVFNLLCDEYQKQIDTSNTTLIAYNQQCAAQLNEESARLKANLVQLLNQHRDRVQNIGSSFNIKAEEESGKVKALQNLIHSVASLNKKTASYENSLLFALPLEIPQNSVAKIEEATHKNVRHLLSHANMPQAKTAILQIDNK